MTPRRWVLTIVAGLALVGVVVGVAVALSGGRDEPETVETIPPGLVTPSADEDDAPAESVAEQADETEAPMDDGEIVVPDAPPDADVEVATSFIELWMSYDSDDIDDFQDEVAAIAEDGSVPAIPELGWESQWETQHSQSWRALVSVPGRIAPLTPGVYDGVTEVPFMIDYLTQFTYEETDCPWGEMAGTTGDDHCDISYYEGRGLWTVLVVDGVVVGVEEPDVIGD